MYRSVDLRVACCEIRKVEPLKRKLATLDAWVAGLRREQWKTRKNIAKVEVDRDHGGIVKLNPMADWKLDEVWDYVRKNEVPYHELFDHGYTSIGCAPCTRPVLPGQSERAGRWWWEEETDKECGLHCSVGLLGIEVGQRARRHESASDDRGGIVAMPFGYPVFLELAGRHARRDRRDRGARGQGRGTAGGRRRVGDGRRGTSGGAAGVARGAGPTCDGRASHVAARRSRRGVRLRRLVAMTLPSALRSRAKRATAGSW